MKVLFDLHSQPAVGLVQRTNEQLAEANPDYLQRFGPIGSDVWWRMYDSGRISRTTLVGEIVHIGPTTDPFGASWDVVRILTDRGELEYERERYWRDPSLDVARWITIERVEIRIETVAGPSTTVIDVRICLDAENSTIAHPDGRIRALLDVPGIDLDLSADEIVDTIRQMRERES